MVLASPIRFPSRWLLPALAFALLPCAPVRAFGLTEAWQAALQADPQFRAARYERQANDFAVPLARSQLLPNVSANSSDSAVRGDRSQIAPGADRVDSPLAYTATSRSLNLRQAVYAPESLARLRQAQVQVVSGAAVLDVRAKDLLQRLATAYFDLQLALEAVELGKAQVATYREAIAYARRRLTGGEGTRTEVAEAEARLDLAEAQLIDAQDQVDVSRRNLTQITGRDAAAVGRRDNMPFSHRIEPAGLDAWLAMAERDGAEIRARRAMLEVAREEVSRARAGHLPRVDFVASVSQSRNDTVNTLNSAFNLRSAGIQISVPLYSGGQVTAATQQALAALSRAQAELDAELNSLRIEVRRQFLAVSNGQAKMSAYEKAVSSSEVARDGTRKGLEAGIRTNIDVLDAERQIFQARRDFVQARYQVLLAVLKLKAAAGLPLDEVTADIDRMMTGTR